MFLTVLQVMLYLPFVVKTLLKHKLYFSKYLKYKNTTIKIQRFKISIKGKRNQNGPKFCPKNSSNRKLLLILLYM